MRIESWDAIMFRYLRADVLVSRHVGFFQALLRAEWLRQNSSNSLSVSLIDFGSGVTSAADAQVLSRVLSAIWTIFDDPAPRDGHLAAGAIQSDVNLAEVA
jgi:hypothetical protein